MQKNYHEEKVYNYLLLCFYFKVFHYGEILPQQKELAQKYEVSLQSIKKAISMLQKDGLVETKKSAGTRVTFNFNNSSHLSKVPLYKSNPEDKSVNCYYLPMSFFSFITYKGLAEADDKHLKELQICAQSIIDAGDSIERRVHAIVRFQMLLIEQIKNCHFAIIAKHFFTNYLFFHVYDYFDDNQKDFLECMTKETYTQIIKCIQDRDFKKAALFSSGAYDKAYSVPNVFSFLQITDQVKLFPDKTLQQEITDYILMICIKNKLVYGDVITFEVDLATKYNVSIHAIKRVTSYLSNLGLIKKEKAKGIMFNINIEDSKQKKLLLDILKEKKKIYYDAFDLIKTSNIATCQLWADRISAIHLENMKKNLEKMKNSTDYPMIIISDLTFVPIMKMQKSSDIAKCYHAYVFSFVQEYSKTFLNADVCENTSKSRLDILNKLEKSFDALENKKYHDFADLIEAANEMNTQLQVSIIDKELTSWIEKLSNQKQEKQFYLSLNI